MFKIKILLIKTKIQTLKNKENNYIHKPNYNS